MRLTTLAAGVAVWAVAATLLWRTQVPGSLRLPSLDEDVLFGRELVEEAERYELVLDLLWVAATVAGLVVLVALARRGRRLVRGLGLGRVNAGIVAGVVALTALWAVGAPFALATTWWQRRHGVSYESYAAALGGAWGGLLGTVLIGLAALAVVLGLARRLPRTWWLASVPVLAGALLVLQLLVPLLLTAGTKPLPRGELASAIERLEDRERAGDPSVRVQRVSDRTRAANAFSIGIGPTEHVVFWDTLLRDFDAGEIRFVAAHELAHLARDHALKAVWWFALLALPVLGAVALATSGRGGLREPANVPLALLVVTLASLAVLPARTAISRRYETEADWIALEATRDPAAARGLFKGFVPTSLQDPSPPGWVHILRDDHPSILQRVELARAWTARRR